MRRTRLERACERRDEALRAFEAARPGSVYRRQNQLKDATTEQLRAEVAERRRGERGMRR